MSRPPVELPRFSVIPMLTLAAQAVGKVDRDGMRGVSNLSLNEIEAMAGALVTLGLIAIPPGGPVPAVLVIHPTIEA